MFEKIRIEQPPMMAGRMPASIKFPQEENHDGSKCTSRRARNDSLGTEMIDSANQELEKLTQKLSELRRRS
ncbi:hypothetical protein RP20_CCG019586 [Aedes albopictus]|nr:hypothetical protein RP20_CCG019586 [Aedes albopictus]